MLSCNFSYFILLKFIRTSEFNEIKEWSLNERKSRGNDVEDIVDRTKRKKRCVELCAVTYLMNTSLQIWRYLLLNISTSFCPSAILQMISIVYSWKYLKRQWSKCSFLKRERESYSSMFISFSIFISRFRTTRRDDSSTVSRICENNYINFISSCHSLSLIYILMHLSNLFSFLPGAVLCTYTIQSHKLLFIDKRKKAIIAISQLRTFSCQRQSNPNDYDKN